MNNSSTPKSRRVSPHRKTPADYHALAKRRGFKWLGPEATSVDTKTWWLCSNSHKWHTRYKHIRKGVNCPRCSGRIPKTPEDYHALAKQHQIEWVGPLPQSVMHKTEWQCNKGHKWQARHTDIRKPSGCPTCKGIAFGNRRRATAEDYHTRAKEYGFKWLGPYTGDAFKRTRWQCKKGHIFEARYVGIGQGYGCPTCARSTSSQQRKLCKMLKGKLNQQVKRWVIDIALNIDGVKIAVEYDGWYWHGAEKEQEHDARRDKKIIAAGWRVLRVKSRTKLPTRKQLDTAINSLLNGDTYAEIILDDWGQGDVNGG